MKNMIFAEGLARPNQPCFQTAEMSKNFWTNKIQLTDVFVVYVTLRLNSDGVIKLRKLFS